MTQEHGAHATSQPLFTNSAFVCLWAIAGKEGHSPCPTYFPPTCGASSRLALQTTTLQSLPTRGGPRSGSCQRRHSCNKRNHDDHAQRRRCERSGGHSARRLFNFRKSGSQASVPTPLHRSLWCVLLRSTAPHVQPGLGCMPGSRQGRRERTVQTGKRQSRHSTGRQAGTSA